MISLVFIVVGVIAMGFGFAVKEKLIQSKPDLFDSEPVKPKGYLYYVLMGGLLVVLGVAHFLWPDI